MKASYQHKIISQHLQNKFGHLHNWPFGSAAEIEDELCRERLVISAGDYLVVDADRSGVRCGKTSDFQELAAFSAESWVTPYHEIERAFHDEHADYVEL